MQTAVDSSEIKNSPRVLGDSHISKKTNRGENQSLFESNDAPKQKPEAHHVYDPRKLAKNPDENLDPNSTVKKTQRPKPSPRPQPASRGLLGEISNFISQKGVFITTFLATALNIVSAPLHALNIESPFKNFVNRLSMLASKTHLLTYALSGIEGAIQNNNPILLLSFAIEGVCAFMSNVRTLYLMRGIATALDALPSAFEHQIGRKFNSFGECMNKSMTTWGQIIKDFLSKGPAVFTKNEGHLLGISSIVTILGSVLGLTVSDIVGGTIRDISGAFGDLGFALKKNQTARQSGISYLFGSFLDCIARFFSKTTSKLFSENLGDTFENFRNTFHEFAIAMDRLGQYLFLRYNQEVSGKGSEEFSNDNEGVAV